MKTATEIVSRRCSLDEAGESNSGHLFSSVPAHILDYNFSGFGDDASECKRFIVSIQAIPVCLKTLLLTLVRGHEEIRLVLNCELPLC